MEPEQTEVVATSEPKPSPWTTVTPLSKYLALALFIALPFIGGYIGYTYIPPEIVEVEVDKTDTDSSTPLLNQQYEAGEEIGDYTLYKINETKFYTYLDIYPTTIFERMPLRGSLVAGYSDYVGEFFLEFTVATSSLADLPPVSTELFKKTFMLRIHEDGYDEGARLIAAEDINSLCESPCVPFPTETESGEEFLKRMAEFDEVRMTWEVEVLPLSFGYVSRNEGPYKKHDTLTVLSIDVIE